MANNSSRFRWNASYFPYAFFGILLLLLAAPACTCRLVDCEGNAVFNVRFLSAADSSDLFVTGALPYDSLSVQVLYADGLRPWDHRFTDFPFTENDVIIELEPNLQGYIFHLDAGRSDTLFLQSFQTTDTPCCPGTLVLDHALFRGDTLYLNSNSELLLLL
jgi:hypothetical protein